MTRSFALALVGLTLSTPAFADPIAPSERDECIGCPKRRPPAPAPVPPAAPVPDGTLPVVVNPPPAAPVLPPLVIGPPPTAPNNSGLVRVGVSLVGIPGLWTMTDDVLADDVDTSYTSLPAVEGGVGGYVGLGGHELHAPYVELSGHYLRGSAQSVGWSGGLVVGYTFSENWIVALGGDGLVRDYGVVDQERLARFTGGHGELRFLHDFVEPAPDSRDLLDVRVGLGALIGGGTVRHAVTDEVMRGMDLGAKINFQIGLQGPR
jgi:hypothetical protein